MEEKILMEGITNQVAGLVVKNGHGILTTKRFIYSKHSMAKIMVMGVLVNATKGSYEYDIPLEDIATATADRFRLGHALTITKKDGTVIKYGIAKPKEWQAAFDKAMAGDVQDQPGAPEEAAPVAKSFCSACGAKVEPGAKFCSACGAKI